MYLRFVFCSYSISPANANLAQGQYDLVIREELPLIREAFRKISPKTPYKPKLTITVCGKRHHARFYATKAEDATKNGNTKPGTIQDRGITDVYGFDWYLQVSLDASIDLDVCI